MEQSANLQLPYIMPSQAQKHVTHNEAIRRLDALVQLGVLDRDLSTPPASPADGDRYLVASGGTDAWAGKDGKVAAWQDGAWAFLAPKAGWLLWVADEDRLLGFDGAAWIDAAVHSVNPAPLMGVNATADATNRLVVKSPASLFDEEAGDHRIKINKAAPVGTASLVFQSGYSGRAEFGLAGDDDWHVKVSADGAAWTEALRVDRTTGRVSLPAALPLGDVNQVVTLRHVRELLTANRTYFVRTDGNDGNTGLVEDSGGAFLTIQNAVDTALALDMSIHSVTIMVGAGSFAENLTITGNGNARILIQGAGYDSTIIGAGSGVAIQTTFGVSLRVRDFAIASGASVSLWARYGANVLLEGSLRFNAASARMMHSDYNAIIATTGSAIYVNGSSPYFILCENNGAFSFAFTVPIIIEQNITVTTMVRATLTGLVTFGGSVSWNESAGAVTGKKYDVVTNAIISASGGTIAGSVAGTTATGGQYV